MKKKESCLLKRNPLLQQRRQVRRGDGYVGTPYIEDGLAIIANDGTAVESSHPLLRLVLCVVHQWQLCFQVKNSIGRTNKLRSRTNLMAGDTVFESFCGCMDSTSSSSNQIQKGDGFAKVTPLKWKAVSAQNTHLLNTR